MSLDQPCPICRSVVQANFRYPRCVCAACAAKACSADGRALLFSNIDLSGGFAACYADTHEAYPLHVCFIAGIPCWADEAYFGGIVIEEREEEDPKGLGDP
jgi:hypothetical protein